MSMGRSRREFLGGVGAVGASALSGCLAGGSSGTVSVLSAGSLSVCFDETVGPAFEAATDLRYRGEFHGSNAVMRMVLEGQKRPDVVVSADAGLLREKLQPAVTDWDVVFASNALVITYNPDTAVGAALEAGRPWYQVLRQADATIARSDPDLDPLGYRTVQLFELAQRYYDVDGLAAALEENLVVDPEESHLLAAVETGDRAAAVTYKNMAVDHDLPTVDLPAKLDFSDPAYADFYATATHTLEDGTTVAGTPVLYNLTVPDEATDPDAGTRFIEFMLEHPDLLTDSGLVVKDSFPVEHGDVPAGVVP